MISPTDVGNHIAVIDYGMGNLGSVVNALAELGVEANISSKPDYLSDADAYILPGVGAFPRAMKNMDEMGLIDFLNHQVLVMQKPILGICLGMQLMANDSLEQEPTSGFGWIEGHVVPMPATSVHPSPHVGWNTVDLDRSQNLFDRIDDGAHFFFDHSYKFYCKHEREVIATCSYGGEVVAVLRKDHIFATQFHPEKSQKNGLKLLRNYLNFVKNYTPNTKRIIK